MQAEVKNFHAHGLCLRTADFVRFGLAGRARMGDFYV